MGSLLVAGTTSCTEKSEPVVEEPRPVVGQEEPAEEEPRPETSEPALSVTAAKQVIAEIQGLGGSVDRVAVGRYRPTAPTDPYVRALPHTVPLIMDSLRA